MKDKFILIIETLHVDDSGDQENVSTEEDSHINCSFSSFLFAFLLRAASMLKNYTFIPIINTCR